MKPLPHPTGPLTQPIGPFQPGPPQLPPPPQSPRFPQFPPQHPLSPQSPCPWPWPSSCAHGVPDATGDGGLAFATPAPSPKAVKPSAPAMIASAKIFISFIVQPLLRFRVLQASQSRFLSSPRAAATCGIGVGSGKQRTCLPPCGAPSSHYAGWRADPPEHPRQPTR
jgi:hypothetical protein